MPTRKVSSPAHNKYWASPKINEKVFVMCGMEKFGQNMEIAVASYYAADLRI